MKSCCHGFWRLDRSELVRVLAAGALLASLGMGEAPAQTMPGNGGGKTCVDVRVGTSEGYNCLNRALQTDVPQQRTDGANLTANATSPAPQVGSYNQAATREHLGDNFGRSAIPQRPPPPVYAPLGSR